INACDECSGTEAGLVGNDVDYSETPCGCYVDSFGGIKASTVSTGCGTGSSASLIAEATDGISDRLVYHYAIFTYNRFGHFSAPTSCARAVWGRVDVIPPGGVCNFLLDSFTKLTDAGNIATVELTWENPIDSDFYGIRIYRSSTGYVRDFHYEGSDAEI